MYMMHVKRWSFLRTDTSHAHMIHIPLYVFQYICLCDHIVNFMKLLGNFVLTAHFMIELNISISLVSFKTYDQ